MRPRLFICSLIVLIFLSLIVFNFPVPAVHAQTSDGSPYGGTAAAIPGTIQSENYNTGGEGVAYHDAEATNQGGQYRTSEGVDIEATTDTGAGYDVGWTATGEWEKYTVNVTLGGSYTLNFRVASAQTGGSFHLEVDGSNVTGALTVPNTGGWQTWTTVSKSGVNLSAGQHVLRVYMDAGGGNFNWVNFTSADGGAYGGTPAAIPGTVQAENFNTGGEGVAYHDSDTANNGTQYRTSEGVDIEASADTGTGYDVGWTAAGEWMKYTVSVTTAGAYTVSFRVASAQTGGSFHLEVDGASVTGAMAVPNTGGWQTWTTLTASGVNLSAGQHVLRWVSDAGGGNYNWMSFSTSSTITPTFVPPTITPIPPTVTPTPPPNTIDSTAWYSISNQGNGKCVDDANGGTANGNIVQQWACSANNNNQLWQFQPTSGGYYKVVPYNSTALAWDVTNVSTADGALIQLWTYGGGNNQQWQPVALDSTHFKFVNRNSAKCLDVPGASATDGAQLDQLTCNGSAAQSWQLTKTTQSGPVDFGPNVIIFDPSMSSTTVQNQLNSVFNTQQSNQFGTQRYALLFKPGTYNVDANIGFYTQISGLGFSPTDVTLNHVTADAQWFNGNATQNFWRIAENMKVTPGDGINTWAVSQAAPFRRMYVSGELKLDPTGGGWSSGGFLDDTVVTGQVASGSQQQYFARSSQIGSWSNCSWNCVFVGVSGAPAQSYPTPPYTTIGQAPVISEKPFLYVDASGNYFVFVPGLRTNTSGTTWNGKTPTGTSLPLSQFYIVKPGATAADMNNALAAGKSLLVTPGVYNINQTINVTQANTVILGLGLATFINTNGVLTMQVADVDGVRIAGLLFDAGTTNTNALLQVGPSGASASHASNPTVLSDVFVRVGGAAAGVVTNGIIVNNNNTIIDHTWIWRADHGSGVGWNVNVANTGLIVNGQNVTIYGLFVEHFEKYNVIWNGNGGRVYFFQNELPYDPPNQSSYMNGTTRGYAAYKVANTVTSHEAWGLGSYCYFSSDPSIINDHSFEVPTTAGVLFHDVFTISLGNKGTILHVINNTGAQTPTNTSPSPVVSYP